MSIVKIDNPRICSQCDQFVLWTTGPMGYKIVPAYCELNDLCTKCAGSQGSASVCTDLSWVSKVMAISPWYQASNAPVLSSIREVSTNTVYLWLQSCPRKCTNSMYMPSGGVSYYEEKDLCGSCKSNLARHTLIDTCLDPAIQAKVVAISRWHKQAQQPVIVPKGASASSAQVIGHTHTGAYVKNAFTARIVSLPKTQFNCCPCCPNVDDGSGLVHYEVNDLCNTCRQLPVATAPVTCTDPAIIAQVTAMSPWHQRQRNISTVGNITTVNFSGGQPGVLTTVTGNIIGYFPGVPYNVTPIDWTNQQQVYPATRTVDKNQPCCAGTNTRGNCEYHSTFGSMKCDE